MGFLTQLNYKFLIMQKGNVMKSRYVVRHGDEWASIRDGASRVSKVFDTQAEAINYSRTLAIKEGSELRIQGKNGKFRQCDSHGNDPRKIKG